MVARPGHPDQLIRPEAFREAVQRGELADHTRRRWGRAEEYSRWLSEHSLPSLSLEQAAALCQASGGRRHAEFKNNAIEEIRDSLDFLLYDTIKLEGRFDECVSEDGSYKLAGAGKELISYVLCLRDPSLFAIWNASAERCLRVLKMYPKTMRQGHWGMRYLDLLEVSQGVRLRFGLVDFREVDLFAYWVSKWARESR